MKLVEDSTSYMGGGERVKLLGVWSSPYSRRVEIALKLKGVPFEHVEEDLSSKSTLLLQNNPIHKKIPVLLHNGNSIVESLVILEYIDETWKNHHPLLPQDPYQRAHTRFWAKFIDDKLMPSVWNSFLSKDEEREKAKEKARELLRTLESELKDKNFFGGDEIGYLDIVANVVAFWIERVQSVVGIELLNQQMFPILYKWIQRLYHDVPIVKECLPPKEKHMVYIKARYEAAIVPDVGL